MIGCLKSGLAAARALRSLIAPITGSDFTLSACTTTCAGIGPPGKAAWMRLYVLITPRSCGSVSTPGVAVWRLNAGIARNTSNASAGHDGDDGMAQGRVEDP